MILTSPFRRLGTRTGVLALLMLAMTVTTAQAIATVDMRGTQRISAKASRTPAIAAGPKGQMTSAWTQIGSSIQIMVSDLRFGGWTTPMAIPGSTDGEAPVVVTAPGGGTLVAWNVEHGHPKSGMIGVSYRPAGGTFRPARYLGSTAGGVSNVDPDIAINDAGRMVATWTATGGDGRAVRAAFGTKGSWSAPQTVAGGSVGDEASAPSVALDAAGRAIVLFGHSTDVSTIRQALAPASGSFGFPTVVQTDSLGENDTDNNLRVAANANGQVVAGWGGTCDCTEVFFWKFGVGSTSTGIVLAKQVTNPGNSADPTTGPERKAGSISEVAIDAAGNGTMVWDASVAGLEPDYDYWAAHSTPEGAIGSSAKIGTNTAVVAGEMQVVAADGHVLVSWVSAPAVGSASTVSLTQASHPGAGFATWSTPTVISRASTSADSQALALSSTGIAAIAYRSADRIWANTNAARDRSKPTLTLPRAGSSLSVTRGTFLLKASCPATEAECIAKFRFTRVGSTTLLAVSSAVIPGGTTTQVKFTLTRAGRMLLADGTVRAKAAVTVRDASGNQRSTTRHFQLT